MALSEQALWPAQPGLGPGMNEIQDAISDLNLMRLYLVHLSKHSSPDAIQLLAVDREINLVQSVLVKRTEDLVRAIFAASYPHLRLQTLHIVNPTDEQRRLTPENVSARFSDELFKNLFIFEKDDIDLLLNIFKLPANIEIVLNSDSRGNRAAVYASSYEALLLYLYKLTTGVPNIQICAMFGRSMFFVSQRVNAILHHIFELCERGLRRFDTTWATDPARLQEWADALLAKGAPPINAAGFVDGTCIYVRRVTLEILDNSVLSFNRLPLDLAAVNFKINNQLDILCHSVLLLFSQPKTKQNIIMAKSGVIA